MNCVSSRSRLLAVVFGALVSVTLAGCSTAQDESGSAASVEAQTSASQPAGTTAASVAPMVIPVDGEALGDHVHNLALDGEILFLGTHQGLYWHVPGSELELVSERKFDVMGLARQGSTWIASGHPEPGGSPSDLGLIVSTDGGTTWQERSLAGEVDFHRLTSANDAIFGIAAHDNSLLRSTDRGETWTNLGVSPLFDLAVSPTDENVVVGTTESGPVVSTDGGQTFEAIEGAPRLAFLAWGPTTLYGVAPDGSVHTSGDDGLTWTSRGSVTGQPAAFTANDQQVAILVDDTVLYSTDGAMTFAPRITGIAAH